MEPCPPPVECHLCDPTAAAARPSASAAPTAMEDMPTVAIVIGMAGSGKTSLMQRINAYRHAKDKPPYIINLDPACTNLPARGRHFSLLFRPALFTLVVISAVRSTACV
jgi:hypothetical protein